MGRAFPTATDPETDPSTRDHDRRMLVPASSQAGVMRGPLWVVRSAALVAMAAVFDDVGVNRFATAVIVVIALQQADNAEAVAIAIMSRP